METNKFWSQELYQHQAQTSLSRMRLCRKHTSWHPGVHAFNHSTWDFCEFKASQPGLQSTAHDWRLRCGAVDLYFTLWPQ
ncbi:hypothetical protein I79_022458 [Cricetulus griseus]|uniref:Uncharacterized protein n=1 Tax=Cricetulus griseus TaxID=10029 RepID=G3IFD6_CRIGR|nr:hypothetical protein I79_022458 [Cricetulus griseus]